MPASEIDKNIQSDEHVTVQGVADCVLIKDEKIIAYDSVDTILKNKIIEDVFDIDIEIINKKYFLKGKKKR